MFRTAKYFLERELGEMVLVWVVGICALILSICFGWVAMTDRDGAYFWSVFGYILSALVGTIIYLSGWLGLRRIAKSYIRREFNKLFGVDAPGKNTDSHERAVIQARVDSTLTYWATLFNNDCARQMEIAGKKFNSDDCVAVSDHLITYFEATGWVLSSKKSFWRRHAVASLNGVTVYESFKSYLSAGVAAAA